VVPDASALVDYVLQTARAPAASRAIRAPDAYLSIPALCDIEFTAGVRRALRRGEIDIRRAEEALTDYLDLPLTRYGHASLLQRILDLRDKFTAYDATYVALADSLDARLVTSDKRLAAAIRTHAEVSVAVVE
jgi:predicted nucleic acid-binding protein